MWGDCQITCPLPHEEPQTTQNPQTTQKPHKFTGNKCNYMKIRKNVNRLTPEEKDDLTNALMQAMNNGIDFEKYEDIANYHGAPYILGCLNDSGEKASCCPHSDPMDFLTWHRLYMVQMEMILHPYLSDKTLGLPYWDWTEEFFTPKIPDLWRNVPSKIKQGELLTIVYDYLNDNQNQKFY